MKGLTIAAAIGLVFATATPALAQTSNSPVSRADVAGTLGWFNAKQSVPDIGSYGNDWYSRSLYVGGSAGWYWNDHLKSEVQAGASTEGELQGAETTFVNGRANTVYSTYTFRTVKLAVGQQYQFFRNAWVHPFIGGGVDFTWEFIERYDEVIPAFPASGFVRVERPERREFHTRPFANFGLKAYITQRGFFRSDMKLVANSHGLDEVILRLGFGIDF
jgi:hypothetical protein